MQRFSVVGSKLLGSKPDALLRQRSMEEFHDAPPPPSGTARTSQRETVGGMNEVPPVQLEVVYLRLRSAGWSLHSSDPGGNCWPLSLMGAAGLVKPRDAAIPCRDVMKKVKVARCESVNILLSPGCARICEVELVDVVGWRREIRKFKQDAFWDRTRTMPAGQVAWQAAMVDHFFRHHEGPSPRPTVVVLELHNTKRHSMAGAAAKLPEEPHYNSAAWVYDLRVGW